MRKLSTVLTAFALMFMMSGSTLAAPMSKVSICHFDKDTGTYFLINVNGNAEAAHLKHGDVHPGDLIPGSSTQKFSGDCSVIDVIKTFSASNSSYYNGLNQSDGLYATGAFSFMWNANTGMVTGGSYDETVGTNLYSADVVSGTVSAGNVTLNFHRNSDNYSYSFTGTLSSNTLTGQLDGPYLFTATGTVTP